MNIRRELICTARQAYADRLFAATSGNLSIFDRVEGKIYITPGSFPYEQMTEADAMVIDLDGSVLQGAHRPSSEWRLHTAVYRAYPEVNAVVHTHSPYATSFAINRTPIPAVLYEMEQALQGLPERRFLTEYRSRSCLIGQTVELAKDDGTVKKVAVLEIADDCGLVVRDSFGNVETLHAGEVHIGAKGLQG